MILATLASLILWPLGLFVALPLSWVGVTVPGLCPAVTWEEAQDRRLGTGHVTWYGPYLGLMWFPVIRGQVWRLWLGWRLGYPVRGFAFRFECL